MARSFADGGGGPQSALRQGPSVPPRVHHRSPGVRAISPPPPWGDRHGPPGDEKQRTWRTPQQNQTTHMGIERRTWHTRRTHMGTRRSADGAFMFSHLGICEVRSVAACAAGAADHVFSTMCEASRGVSVFVSRM